MTGEPNPPTHSTPPGTPDEKLTLLIATLLDIILTILEALPIPGFLRRPLQNRARHECAALLTRLLATRVPAPATIPKPAETAQPPAPKPRPEPRFRVPARAPAPPDPITAERETIKHDAVEPPRRSRPRTHKIHPTRARHATTRDRSPAQKFQKTVKAARSTHAQIVTI